MSKKTRKHSPLMFVLVVVAVFIAAGSMLGGFLDLFEGASGKDLDQLLKPIHVSTAEPVKAAVSLSGSVLYDELPEISKYPLSVTGKGDIDIEIFTSGEKAGTGTDSWLVESAEQFNRGTHKTDSGKTISVSVRSVSSGLAADYIISGKYLPDLYTPSNELFGSYAIVNGGNLELYESRLVGNTAGILVKKNSGYTTVKAVIDDVMAGKLNVGYTNPQTSATGLNLLIDLLKEYGGDDMFGKKAVESFEQFNSNIPFIAYTTQQMRDSASNGTLDGMVSEYQAYINDKNLTSLYEFIPFGTRHDNPMYLVNGNAKSNDEMDAIRQICDFLKSDDIQKIASADGFNALDTYESSYEAAGSEVTQSLSIYKTNKDAGQEILAVFIADCSGSMSGEPLRQLKSSLSNGMQYINESNYVGLVSYSTDVTIEVPIRAFDLTQKSYFQGAVNRMSAQSSTYTYEAVCVGMSMLRDAKKDHPNAKQMLFLLSDGYANGDYTISTIEQIVKESGIPVYTIGYTDAADMAELRKLSNINEAASINADSENIIYQIKSLFNSQL